MQRVAGVGGDVPSLVRTATSGRPVVAIDGCRLACARACLARHGVEPDLHVQLAEHGVSKRMGADPDPVETAELANDLVATIIDRWPTGLPPDSHREIS